MRKKSSFLLFQNEDKTTLQPGDVVTFELFASCFSITRQFQPLHFITGDNKWCVAHMEFDRGGCLTVMNLISCITGLSFLIEEDTEKRISYSMHKA